MKTLPVAALLVLAIALSYANALHAPFVFDDLGSIPDNPSIRHLAARAILSPPPALTVSGRPLLNASFALDYALGGVAVRGYHLVNIALHALAALVLFGLLRRTFARIRPAQSSAAPTAPPDENATRLAFLATLLWAVHPLQTEAVTYIVQRAESLMGLFYLLTLYCFVRGADFHVIGESRFQGSRWWFAAAIATCALGMAVKEVMATAPLVVLLYDRMFVAGSVRELWQRRGRVHLALAATWLVLVAVTVPVADRAGTAGWSVGVKPWEYALFESRALLDYLRLVAWPHPQVFDHGPFVRLPWMRLLPSAIALVAGMTLGLVVFARRRGVFFAGACGLLILAPTSSLLPIETEPFAEHRMYLPLAALAALAVVAMNVVLRRRALLPIVVGALALATLTVQRNATYASALRLWSTTIVAAPENPRAHYSLALAQLAAGDRTTVEKEFKTALELRPDYVAARHALAQFLEDNDRTAEAATEYETILRLRPDDFVALQALGRFAFQNGNFSAAVVRFGQAVHARPDSAVAHNNLGGALYETGDFAGARAQVQAALQLQPDYAEAHFNLGNACARLGDFAAAREHYERALALAPDYAEAHAHLGVVLQNLGDRAAAIAHYRTALRLRPDLAFVRDNLTALGAPP